MTALSLPPDLETLWDYADPAGSETRFRAALPAAQGDVRLELLTQIARTFSLRRQFAAAQALLNEIEPQLAEAGPRPHIRYQLERGRTFNSSGDPAAARPCFLEAWTRAQAHQQAGLAVDAAHMVAITYAGTPAALAWHERGLAIARQAADAQAQALLPALLNNSAWDLHDMGRFAEALALFEEARAVRVARGQPAQIQIATWAVARCLRSVGRYAEALTWQYTLEAQHYAAGTTDGYVFEEIGENLTALGQPTAAKLYFGQAYHALSQDPWFVQNAAARLAAIKQRAGLI